MRKPIVLAGLCCLAACGGDDAPTIAEVEAQVFTTGCALQSCHGMTGNPPGGLNLTAPVFAKIVNVDSTQKPGTKLVVPGSPDTSYLMDKMLGRNLPAPPMGERRDAMPPPSGGLEADRIEMVRAWIAAGAKNE
jgi:hypothetical protein